MPKNHLRETTNMSHAKQEELKAFSKEQGLPSQGILQRSRNSRASAISDVHLMAFIPSHTSLLQ